MTTVTLATTGAGTWGVPPDCPAGTSVTVEAWGAGSGASGRISAGGGTFGAAGAGGAYASNAYTITPNDVASGVVFALGAGTAGLSGANPAAGGDTSWSTNNLNLLQDSIMTGAVSGSPGSLPVNFSDGGGGAGLTRTISKGFVSGFYYIDIRYNGTSADTGVYFYIATSVTATVATYAASVYQALVGGSASGVTFTIQVDASTAGSVYISSPINSGNAAFTPTATLTRTSAAAANPATTALINMDINIGYSSGAAIDFTLRIAAPQYELAGAASFYKSTPGYTLAKGGGAPSGTTGGTGGATATSIGTTKFAGGNGAAFNANGSGGGGSGGKDGAGVAGNTSGQGGQGDSTSGGLGGAVKATSPGNPGIDNIEGGGGGGGLKTVSGTGGLAGVPGGGGGGAAVATSTGGTGARGQIRLTYVSWAPIEVVAPPRPIQIWDH